MIRTGFGYFVGFLAATAICRGSNMFLAVGVGLVASAILEIGYTFVEEVHRERRRRGFE